MIQLSPKRKTGREKRERKHLIPTIKRLFAAAAPEDHRSSCGRERPAGPGAAASLLVLVPRTRAARRVLNVGLELAFVGGRRVGRRPREQMACRPAISQSPYIMASYVCFINLA